MEARNGNPLNLQALITERNHLHGNIKNTSRRLMGRINSLRTSFSPQFETRVAPAVPEPEMFPYYLRQPKAKNAHYLKIGEVIIVEEEGLWERAKITDIDLKRYENLSMLITFESERSKDSTTRYLFPGELWGVLRGEDVHLDFTKMRPSVAAGQTQRVRLVSECPQCTASHLLIHPEERSQLQSFLPFTCSHRATAASIVQIAPAPTDLGGVSWEVPRPRHPALLTEPVNLRNPLLPFPHQ